MEAEAGVGATYDFNTDGEGYFGTGGLASASGDIDFSLSNGGEIANFDDAWDKSVGAADIQSNSSDLSGPTTSIEGPDGGALTPAAMGAPMASSAPTTRMARPPTPTSRAPAWRHPMWRESLR